MEPLVPDSYSQLLADLKGRIQATQIRASLAINRELGVGFAFVGSQYRLTVGNGEFYIDLLFYHLKLRDVLCIRLRPERPNHVWSYASVEARTHDGRSLRLNGYHVIETQGECMLQHGVPEHVRSDNGAEMTARRVRNLAPDCGHTAAVIEWGSPWENGYCESFAGKQRDECLNGEIFYSFREAQVVVEIWREHHNTVRPHSALV